MPGRLAPLPPDDWIRDLLAGLGLREGRRRIHTRMGSVVLQLSTSRDGATWFELGLRVYPRSQQDLGAIETEWGWLEQIAALGAAAPVPQRDGLGNRWHRLPDGRLAVVVTWVAGRRLDRSLHPAHLRAAGRLLATLHQAADRLAAEGGVRTRRAVDGPDLQAWAQDVRPTSAVWPAASQAAAVRTARRILQQTASWPRTPASHGLAHGDLHPWNLLYRGPRQDAVAAAIDFSDVGIGWRALDFASVLQYLRHPLAGFADHRPQYARLYEQLLLGYTDRRALWPGVESQIETMRQARWLNTVEWVLDVWPHPDRYPFGRPLLADLPERLAPDA